MRTAYLMGLPGSGKTTLINKWKEAGGLTVPEFLEEVPPYVVNAWSGGAEERREAQRWVVDQHRMKNSVIESYSHDNKDRLVLVDRCPIEAVFYSSVFDQETASYTLGELARTNWSVGFFIWITTDLDVLHRRIVNERGRDESEWQDQWLPLSTALLPWYKKLSDEFGVKTYESPTASRDSISIDKLAEFIDVNYRDFDLNSVVNFFAKAIQ